MGTYPASTSPRLLSLLLGVRKEWLGERHACRGHVFSACEYIWRDGHLEANSLAGHAAGHPSALFPDVFPFQLYV